MKNWMQIGRRAAKTQVRCVTMPWCGVAVVLVGLTLGAEQATASDSRQGPIAGTGTCPESGAVWSALSALVGLDRLEGRLRTLPGAAPPVAVTDLGTVFRVRAGQQVRDYEDDVRDCANRARLAALFVALAVDSVEQSAKAKATASAPRSPSAAPAPLVAHPEAVSPPATGIAHLELGVDGRFGFDQSTGAPGGLLRVSGGRGLFALVMGARGSAPRDVTMAGLRVRQWRAAADLAVRARWSADRPVTPFVELGATAVLLSERAPDLAVASAHLAGELGFVVGGGMGFHRRSWGSVFFLLEGEIDPDPPTLSALPTGSLGRTPRVWLGAAMGLSMGLF